MISVFFLPIHPPPALLFPSNISRHAQWVVLTLYKLESPEHQEIFSSASRKILMCSKIWETRLYMLSALVFSNLAWKDSTVLSYSSLKKKKMLLHLQWIQTHSSLIRCLCWEGSHHHTRCFSAKLAYSLSSPLNFFLIFLFILPRLWNYYRSTVIPRSFQLLFKFLSLAIVGICLPV